MIYDLSLRTAGLLTGFFLLAVHTAVLIRPSLSKDWLRRFPRSRPLGTILCIIAAVWAYWLAATMDLGEFSPHRTLICGVILLGGILVPIFASEFLAVRSLGILILLAAEPLLGAAFLRPEESRLLLVILAYFWIVIALFIVGAPYLLRDALSWLLARPWRFQLAAWSGIAYGAALIVVSWAFYAPLTP